MTFITNRYLFMLHLYSQNYRFIMKRNIGSVDRMVRLLIAFVAFVVYSRSLLNSTMSIIILIVGLLMFVTAFMRFCPLYSLLQISTYKPEADFKLLLSQGATIIDVREPGEFNSGHIKGSTNIPLSKLSTLLSSLKNKTVIACCASGARSAIAKRTLAAAGIKAYNGGSWRALNAELG